MSERSIITRLKADITDLQSKLRQAAADTVALGKATEQANRTSASSSQKTVAAEKQLAAAAAVRAAVRKAAAEDEIRSNERLRISTEKYGKATATVLQHKDSIDKVGRGLGIAGTIAAAGVGVAVNAFANFDQAMSSVAATGSDARANLTRLREAAVDAGAATKYSATEAAGGVEALLKAGVSAQDVLGGGLKGALNLAAAGNLDVAQSAEAAASAMNQFGLAGKDVPHIADLLAAGAGNAQGEVSDMAAALGQVGLIAHSTGLSIEDTVGTLTAFGKAGLVGSDAGTSFKSMLQSLTPNSKQAAVAMKEIGLNAYDAQGNFVGITKVAEQLRTGLSKLSDGDKAQKLKTIFGADGIRGANILYEQGAKGLNAYIDGINKQGFAADVAATKMDNLKGDVEQFKGSLETSLIGLGSGANAPFRKITQDATSFVNTLNKIPQGTKGAILGTVGGLGGIALAGAGLLKVATTAATARAALVDLAGSSPRLAANLGSLGKTVGIGVTALVALEAALVGVGAVSRQFKANVTSDLEGANKAILSLADSGDQLDLDKLFNFTSSGFGATIQATDSLGSSFQRLKMSGPQGVLDSIRLGIDKFTGTTGVINSVNQRFADLDSSLTGLASSGSAGKAASAFKDIADAAELQRYPVEDLVKLFPNYANSIRDVAKSSGYTITSAQELADIMGGNVPDGLKKAASATAATKSALAALTGGTEKQSASLDELLAKLQTAESALLAMRGGQVGMEQAIDNANASLKANGKTLDVHTAKGRANRTALDQIAASTGTYVASLVKGGASAQKIVAANERGRSSFIATAKAMGLGSKAANALAADLFRIPKDIRAQVVVAGGKVSRKEAADLNRELQLIPKEQRARIVTIAETKGAKAARAALNEIRDKRAIAKVVGDIKGAKNVRDAMARLRDRLVEAKARGDKRGADIVRAAMNALKGKKVDAKAIPSGEGGVRAINSAINAMHSKTVTATIVDRHIVKNAATGGMVTSAGVMMRGPLHRSNGGAVWGEGSATSDSIPAMLSDGEWVHRAAAVDYYGAGVMDALNRKLIPKDAFSAYGFKDGGKIGHVGLGFATGGSVDQAAILKLVAKDTNPLHDINAARRDIEEAKRDKRRADTHRERVKANRELTAATKKLTEAQKAVAETVKQAAASLADPYRSKSHDIDDWLESMKQGAEDLKLFQGQIGQLRKLGVSEAIIKQITDQGAIVGSELASQILDGGKSLATTLNKANTELEKASANLAYSTTTPKGHALGGLHVGPGSGTSDSILARVSNGEWTVPQRNVQSNLGLLKSMTYGPTGPVQPATSGGQVVHIHHHAGNVDHGDIKLEGVIGDPDRWLRKARQQKKDSLAMAGLRGRS